MKVSMALASIASESESVDPIRLWVPVAAAIISLVAALIAIGWSTLQAKQRGARFQRLIRRELSEISPHPIRPIESSTGSPRPWWEYAKKRFIHEEIFRGENVTANREFLLSLNPTVVYQVSQLWIALEKRDGTNWLDFLKDVANNPRLRSEKLSIACSRWEEILKAQEPKMREPMGIPTSYRQAAALSRAPELFQARLKAYAELLPHLDYDRLSARQVDAASLDHEMRAWYYEDGNGLLLSGRSLEQFQRTRTALRVGNGAEAGVNEALSVLRTDLKIDLGVRQPQERDVGLAWPEDERW